MKIMKKPVQGKMSITDCPVITLITFTIRFEWSPLYLEVLMLKRKKKKVVIKSIALQALTASSNSE